MSLWRLITIADLVMSEGPRVTESVHIGLHLPYGRSTTDHTTDRWTLQYPPQRHLGHCLVYTGIM